LSSSDRESVGDVEYVSLIAEVPESEVERAEMVLHDSGALGLEVQDPSLLPMPGRSMVATGAARVTGYFLGLSAAFQAEQRLRAALPGVSLTRATVPSEDWSVSWRASIKPVRVGRLWVGPPWEDPDPDSISVVIDPKMAFGTGDHPTTGLCLQAIDEYLRSHRDAEVLDVGTGSGVLAIAARKLGARRAVAVDTDPIAVANAKENALRNGIADIELILGTLEAVSDDFDLVVANILANTLVELAPRLAEATRHRLVLAGVLVEQQQEVIRAQRPHGLELCRVEQCGEWVRLDFDRASPAVE